MSTLTTCEKCGDEFADDDECAYCADMTTCDDCGSDVHVDDTHYLSAPYRWGNRSESEGHYCNGCVSYCPGCCEYHLEENFTYLSGIGERCTECAEQYISCDDCGSTLDREWDDYRITDDGEVLCEDCDHGHDEAAPVTTCPTCHTARVHFHMTAETFVCDCHARTADGTLIVLAHPIPALVAA